MYTVIHIRNYSIAMVMKGLFLKKNRVSKFCSWKKRVKKWFGSTVFYIEKIGIMLTFFGVTILVA